jgi:hypothetical protein
MTLDAPPDAKTFSQATAANPQTAAPATITLEGAVDRFGVHATS